MKFSILSDGICCRLPTAGMIIGGFGVAASAVIIPFSLMGLIRTLETSRMYEYSPSTSTLVYLSLVLLLGVSYGTVSGCLIYGVLKHIANYFLPWIAVNALVILLILIFIGMHVNTVLTVSTSVLLIVSLVGTLVYMMLCILSLYQLVLDNPTLDSLNNTVYRTTLAKNNAVDEESFEQH